MSQSGKSFNSTGGGSKSGRSVVDRIASFLQPSNMNLDLMVTVAMDFDRVQTAYCDSERLISATGSDRIAPRI